MRHGEYDNVRSGSPEQWAAVAIIQNALREWRYWKDKKVKPQGHLKSQRYAEWNYARSLGYFTPRDELAHFFKERDGMFELCCEIVGESICPDAIRRHLGIENEDVRRIEVQLELMGIDEL